MKRESVPVHKLAKNVSIFCQLFLAHVHTLAKQVPLDYIDYISVPARAVEGLEPQRLQSYPHGGTKTTDMLGWHAHEQRYNKALRATEAT